mmetsp:Transcript_4106/g.5667  ORF Transcript_4106/g.5667 Transcript_4106/m.5667 type:complete len:94 (-) Transcript_4106:324-605(-)
MLAAVVNGGSNAGSGGTNGCGDADNSGGNACGRIIATVAIIAATVPDGGGIISGDDSVGNDCSSDAFTFGFCGDEGSTGNNGGDAVITHHWPI